MVSVTFRPQSYSGVLPAAMECGTFTPQYSTEPIHRFSSTAGELWPQANCDQERHEKHAHLQATCPPMPLRIVPPSRCEGAGKNIGGGSLDGITIGCDHTGVFHLKGSVAELRLFHCHMQEECPVFSLGPCMDAPLHPSQTSYMRQQPLSVPCIRPRSAPRQKPR